MADENPEKGGAEAPAGGGGFFSGTKGWIVVIGFTVLQTVFWLIVIAVIVGDTPSEAPEPQRTLLKDTALLQSKVEFTNFSATVSGAGGGGDLRPLNFSMVLELQYTDDEMRGNSPLPTMAQLEVFRTVVVQLESKLRDHMNTFLTSLSFSNLMGDRGPEMVRTEAIRFMNTELERFDFEAHKIPKNISRRRVTNVLIPTWTLM